jgi:putative FmdB family regulatory protein
VPLYEYRCRECGHELVEVQAMGAGPPGSCPTCGGELKRLFGRVGVRFSGWGFSRTDSLLPEGRRRKDFRTLKDKAEELTDSD